MLSGSLSTALGGVAVVVFLAIAVYIYASLLRQINARDTATIDIAPPKTFGRLDAILALGLILLLLLSILTAFLGRSVELSSRVLLENVLFTIALVLLIVAVLAFRGLDLNSMAGFSRISFQRIVSTAVILLVAAYPFVLLAETITQTLLGGDSSRQIIIDFLNGPRAIKERILIIVFAVAVAPVVEEFLFRFFLYGVLKRYFGRAFGMIFNSLLFGAVHGHLPSFAPLFMLGLCLTIAFEWSGSILVSMTMHALFNSLSLTVLAFPELFSQ